MSEELLELERRVDHIRLVCVDTSQKLVACQPTCNSINPDKRRVEEFMPCQLTVGPGLLAGLQ